MDITLDEFKDKIYDFTETPEWKFKGNKNVTIRFTANWCGPCKSYAPIFKEAASETNDVDFYTVDVDEQPELAQIFSIRSIPTTIFIPKSGNKPTSSVGVLSKKKLNEVIEGLK